jgi:hypothetical protein
MYTLLVYDAASSVSATAEAGYLSAWNTFTFGLYTPQPYQNLSQWKCVTCNAAATDLADRGAMIGALVMCLVTIFSFTWFVAGFGALS